MAFARGIGIIAIIIIALCAFAFILPGISYLGSITPMTVLYAQNQLIIGLLILILDFGFFYFLHSTRPQ